LTIPSVHGVMSTDGPERYAKPLLNDWSARGPVTDEGRGLVQRWTDGRVITLRPGEGSLDVRVSLPEGEEAEHFSHVVTEHLERFRRRDELHVERESRSD